MQTSIYLVKNTWYPEGGWGNGYVVLPKGHKYHGKNYDDIMSGCKFCEELTFAQYDEEDNWIVGWDSNHLGQNKENYPFKVVLDQTRKLEEELNQ